MKYVEDLEDVMHETGITDYAELQKMGYDILSYLKRKQSRLLSRIEEIQNIIDDCDNAKQPTESFPGIVIDDDDIDDLPY